MRPLPRTLLKVSAVLLVGAAALALAAIAYVYYASGQLMRRTYSVGPVSLYLPVDAASLAEGKRLATIRGCHGGCHGRTLEGAVFDDNFLDGRVVAPDLTRVARSLPAEVFARVVREGVRANGESVWSMPSAMFHHLSDANVGMIVAFIRSEAPLNGLPLEFHPGPGARWDMVRGEWKSAREEISGLGMPARSPDPDNPVAFGEYLARTSCSECHGQNLKGSSDTPNLRVVAKAYSADAFARFMRTGIAAGERELRLMSKMARTRFSHFTAGEIAALHAFLIAVPG